MKKVKFVQQGILVKKNVIEDAMSILGNELRTDSGYRMAWYANLKFAIYDNANSKISQKIAGEIADDILKKFFSA
jgi:hypothetical protein